jgi:hypothetical protein
MKEMNCVAIDYEGNIRRMHSTALAPICQRLEHELRRK